MKKVVRKAIEILAFGFFINSTQMLLMEASKDSNTYLAITSSLLIAFCLWLDYRNYRKEQK